MGHSGIFSHSASGKNGFLLEIPKGNAKRTDDTGFASYAGFCGSCSFQTTEKTKQKNLPKQVLLFRRQGVYETEGASPAKLHGSNRLIPMGLLGK